MEPEQSTAPSALLREKKIKELLSDINKTSQRLRDKSTQLDDLLKEEKANSDEYINKQRQEITDAREKVNKEQEKIQSETNKLGFKIKLDVGGTLFSTSKSTLLSQPGTYFSTMLTSGKYAPQEDGSYFIDRNPKHFEVMLEYLRTGLWNMKGMSEAQVEALEHEADFYQIPLPEGVRKAKSANQNRAKTADLRSSILNDENNGRNIITKWLPEGKGIGERLYQGSRDTFRSEIFHRRCDNQGPTLVVVKTQEGHIFGGYASASWTSGSAISQWASVAESAGCFLFTLKNRVKTQPTKLPLTPGKSGICGQASRAAHFGDFIIQDLATDPLQYTTVLFPTNYQDPTGHGGALFKDSTNKSTVAEIEVFRIV